MTELANVDSLLTSTKSMALTSVYGQTISDQLPVARILSIKINDFDSCGMEELFW